MPIAYFGASEASFEHTPARPKSAPATPFTGNYTNSRAQISVDRTTFESRNTGGAVENYHFTTVTF